MTSAPTLVLSRGGREVLRIPFDKRVLRLGRAADCDLRLPEPRLSRVHCELKRRASGVFVVDSSVNGTFLDGRRLPTGEPALLRPGAELSVPGWVICLERAKGGEGSTELGRPAPERPASSLGMVGSSLAMASLRERIRRYGRFDAPVLVFGETGTGKELVARAVHACSDRARGPFVAVNCGAIHGPTAHARLFGHEKGAFTGADRAAPGAFREADHGTLFLDELGELPLDQQTALLRVLERREVVPLGSVKPIPVDFRLVAATHRDLRELVALGDFREDLYYRLDVASLPVPPLRERVEDIPELARFFLRDLPRERYELTEAALDALLRHPWPGNVRELRNCLHRGALASETGVIGFRELELRERQRTLEAPVPSGLMARDVAATWEEPVSERARIVRALERAGGNRREAARMLGIARSTLYERMRRLGL